MTQKSMSYDHPAYTAVRSLPTGSITGSGGAGSKYAAFTAAFIKSVTLRATTAPGANSVMSLIQVSGTSTTTVTLGTVGTALTSSTFTNLAPAAGTFALATLAQGDLYYVVNGTDTAGTMVGEIELVTQPTANVTA
jgi:hypothetical protein